MVIVADKHGRTDGATFKMLQKIDTEIPILLITRVENYEFNEEILKLAGKHFIVTDFVEYGWNWNFSRGTHLFGVNTDDFRLPFGNGAFNRLDAFLSENKPAMYFKRELLAVDVSDTVKPIEYPNWQPPFPAPTKEQFDERPISIFNFWGRSHEARVQLHGNIWKGASAGNYSVCDNLYYFNEFMREEKGEKWVSLWMPHYGRVDISNILSINAISKLSLSLPGAGVKCFRSTGESPVNSVMVMKSDDLAWSYPWEHGINCIKFSEFGEEIETIQYALKHSSLYEIFLKGIEIANKYQVDNYINHYLLPNIVQ